jgi:hypothetical protein
LSKFSNFSKIIFKNNFYNFFQKEFLIKRYERLYVYGGDLRGDLGGDLGGGGDMGGNLGGNLGVIWGVIWGVI